MIKSSSNRKDSDLEFEMELDLSNRSFVINSEESIIETKIGNFQYSPIVVLSFTDIEIQLL